VLPHVKMRARTESLTHPWMRAWWVRQMMPTAARVVAANAAVIAEGAASCSVRSAAAISWARASRLRCRPARLRADRILATLRCAASAGVGARPRTARASRSLRSALREYYPAALEAFDDLQVRWCAGCGPRPGSGVPGRGLDRLGFGAVAGYRAVVVPVGADQVASSLASPASDFAPET
jgi:hypothetical protein